MKSRSWRWAGLMSRYLIIMLAITLAGAAGGSALVANSALATRPASIKTRSDNEGVYSVTTYPLEHPASSPAPVVAATPRPKATSKATARLAVKASPSASAAPWSPRTSRPAPAATPRPKASAPKPAPTATGPRTSGALPPVTVVFNQAGVLTTQTGDSFHFAQTCPGTQVNCVPSTLFTVEPWGNNYLVVSWTETITYYVIGGPGQANQTLATDTASSIGIGLGSQDSLYHQGFTGSANQSMDITITVAWA